jgi:hypothetical protein
VNVTLSTKSDRFFALIPVSTILLGLSVYFYFFRHSPNIGIALFIAGLVLPLFAWAMGYTLTPVLIINDEGILDRRLGVGLIRWAEIEGAQLEVNYNNRYVCLRVRSPKQFIHNAPGPRKEKLIQKQNLGFTSFNIDVRDLRVNLLELINHIEQKSAQYRSHSTH